MSDDIAFLRGATVYGSMNSQDKSTHNGAVLVKKGNVIAYAANVFPKGVRHRHEKPSKYAFIEHAERGAIFAAAKAGRSTRGATLYCPWFACPDCARAIVCAGIERVVGSAKASNMTPARWQDAIRDGLAILREGGVDYSWVSDPLDVVILFDQKRVEL